MMLLFCINSGNSKLLNKISVAISLIAIFKFIPATTSLIEIRNAIKYYLYLFVYCGLILAFTFSVNLMQLWIFTHLAIASVIFLLIRIITKTDSDEIT